MSAVMAPTASWPRTPRDRGRRERERTGRDGDDNAIAVRPHDIEREGVKGDSDGQDGHAGDRTEEGGAELTGVGYVSDIGPRWRWVKGGRGSGDHATAGGDLAGDSRCPRWRWRLAGGSTAAPCNILSVTA
jgi:hypothetical protein